MLIVEVEDERELIVHAIPLNGSEADLADLGACLVIDDLHVVSAAPHSCYDVALGCEYSFYELVL